MEQKTRQASINESNRKYRANNPEKAKESSKKYRSTTAGNYYDAAINKTKKETIMLVIERLQVAIEKSH